MVGIPPSVHTDVEDVVWALQTASSLWNKNERVDAIVWLRRAAQAAGEAQDDERALLLAREAAELSEWIAKNPVHVSSSFPAVSSIPPNDSASSGGGVDDLLRASIPDIPIEEGAQVSMSAMTEPHAFAPVKLGLLQPQAVPVTPPPPVPTSAEGPAVAEVFQSVAQEPSSASVPSAEEAHAGLLDPWSTPPEVVAPPPSPRVTASTTAVASSDDYDDEVVTSARLELPEAPVIMAVPPVAPPPLPLRPPAPLEERAPESIDPAALQSIPVGAPDEDARAALSAVNVQSEETMVLPPSPALRAAATPAPVIRFPVEQTLVSAGVVPPAAPPAALDLSAALALADLPDDVRAELERVAEIHRLARDEEVMGFALAFVVDGVIDVAAQIVDAPAQRIGIGKVLKAKGTIGDGMPLRLICASEAATVATWDAAQIEPAFKTCPWVEDDLRASANRVQALVGVTLGPLADRLDATLRAQVTNKLELRELAEGAMLVEAGQPVRELCLVGQGSIELLTNGEVTGEVGPGEFLFPAEIMSGAKAGATARVGKGGALVLASDRSVAQELMSTCPPLLEIFAGM